MYCRNCGASVPDDSAFCPRCGAAQHPDARSGGNLPDGLIVAALVFMLPLGLILMWTSSGWKRDTKLAISGIFFPPLWLLLIWDQPWPREAKALLVAALVAVNAFWIGVAGGA